MRSYIKRIAKAYLRESRDLDRFPDCNPPPRGNSALAGLPHSVRLALRDFFLTRKQKPTNAMNFLLPEMPATTVRVLRVC